MKGIDLLAHATLKVKTSEGPAIHFSMTRDQLLYLKYASIPFLFQSAVRILEDPVLFVKTLFSISQEPRKSSQENPLPD